MPPRNSLYVIARRGFLAVCVVVTMFAVSACQATTEIRPEGQAQAATEPADDSSAITPNSGEQESDADDRAAEADSAGITPSQVFERARQSVVSIGTAGDGRGSGVAIEGGWILTNAHVVGRAREVRVVASDGEELGQVPIHAVDPVLDLAVLGPLADNASPLPPIVQGTGSDVQVGETVYLLGYPDETNTLPIPTLTEGILNRRRSVVLRDYAFLQVDASIAPGQSGGALLDDEGALIGLSGIRFGAAAFGLALETESLMERSQALIEGPRSENPLDGEPITEFEDVLGPSRYIAFMAESDGRIEVEVTSPGDTFIEILTAAGSQKFEQWEGWDYFVDVPRSESDYFRDRSLQGTERLSVAVDPGAYQVLVGSFDTGPAPASITSSGPLFPLADIEEGAVLSAGEVAEGEFGWTKDSDKWKVPLRDGDQATIIIDGIGDFFGVVRLGDFVISSNDDAGFGVFGLGARLEFTATEDADYELEIGTRDGDRHGYFVKLEVN